MAGPERNRGFGGAHHEEPAKEHDPRIGRRWRLVTRHPSHPDGPGREFIPVVKGGSEEPAPADTAIEGEVANDPHMSSASFDGSNEETTKED